MKPYCVVRWHHDEVHDFGFSAAGKLNNYAYCFDHQADADMNDLVNVQRRNDGMVFFTDTEPAAVSLATTLAKANPGYNFIVAKSASIYGAAVGAVKTTIFDDKKGLIPG